MSSAVAALRIVYLLFKTESTANLNDFSDHPPTLIFLLYDLSV